MKYSDIWAQEEARAGSEDAAVKFLSLDLVLEKQIRALEFAIGKGASTDVKKLEALKKKRVKSNTTQVDVRAKVLERSNMPGFKIKAVPELSKQYEALATYAAKFPRSRKPNIVLTGNTGTGKTYALTFLGHELIENKVFALYVTAFSMVDRFKRFVFERDEAAFAEMLNAQVLLIDDIGTEPRIPNITDENLYNLINERLLAGRPFVISTNLSPNELLERYGERIGGRILAKETTSIVKFDGKDMRLGQV